MDERENAGDKEEQARTAEEIESTAHENTSEQAKAPDSSVTEQAGKKGSGERFSGKKEKLVVPLLIAVVILLAAVVALSAILIARTGRSPVKPAPRFEGFQRPFLERREKMLERLDEFKEAVGIKEFTGEVLSVEEGALTIKTSSGEVKIKTTDKTRYTLQGRMKRGEELGKPKLEQGDKVRVLAHEGEDGQLEAVLIRSLLR